jgi:hypothetical protein
MARVELHGHQVEHDEHDHHGYDYLAHKIDAEEAKVLFSYAKEHGTAQFETHDNKNYSVVHNSNGTFTIMKR